MSAATETISVYCYKKHIYTITTNHDTVADDQLERRPTTANTTRWHERDSPVRHHKTPLIHDSADCPHKPASGKYPHYVINMASQLTYRVIFSTHNTSIPYILLMIYLIVTTSLIDLVYIMNSINTT